MLTFDRDSVVWNNFWDASPSQSQFDALLARLIRWRSWCLFFSFEGKLAYIPCDLNLLFPPKTSVICGSPCTTIFYFLLRSSCSANLVLLWSCCFHLSVIQWQVFHSTMSVYIVGSPTILAECDDACCKGQNLRNSWW